MRNHSVVCDTIICSLLFAVVTAGSSRAELPDHLEPFLPSYFNNSNFAEYYSVVHKSLIGGESGLKLAMVTRPSFFSENAVIIREITVSDTLRYHRVEFAVADPMIWALQQGHAGVDSVPWQDQIEIYRDREEVPDSLYELIDEAWRTALLQTRFADPDVSETSILVRADGVDFECFLWREDLDTPPMAGHTWSPEKGVAKMMVDLGGLMRQYVMCSVPERVEVSKKIATLAREIINQTRE